MNTKSIYHRILFLVFAFSLLLQACGTFQAEALAATPTTQVAEPMKTEASTPTAQIPTATEGAVTPTLAATPEANSQWVEFRDDFWGYAVAIPCWWPVYAARPDGFAASTTVSSYDETYFMTHSSKGGWIGGDFPQGALKIDFTMMRGIEPAADTLELAKNTFTGGDPGLVNSFEEIMLGENQAIKMQVRDAFDSEEIHTVYVFRPANDRLFAVSVAPEEAYASPDIQGILESLSFSAEQPARLPGFAPMDPIIPVPEVCDQPRIVGAP